MTMTIMKNTKNYKNHQLSLFLINEDFVRKISVFVVWCVLVLVADEAFACEHHLHPHAQHRDHPHHHHDHQTHNDQHSHHNEHHLSWNATATATSRSLSSVMPGSMCGFNSPSEEEIIQLEQEFVQWKNARSGNNDRYRNLRKLKKKKKKKNGGNQSGGRIAIPVYVHVIEKSNGEGRVSGTQIRMGYMKRLNEAYANTGFFFDLQGITTTVNDDWYYCTSQNEYAIKKALRKTISGGPTTKNVLNVYICDPYYKTFDGFRGIMGWAYAPWGGIAGTVRDGAINANPYVMLSSDSADERRRGAYSTLVHEVGHWLGLLHVFEGGCTPNRGDLVSDTPAAAGPPPGFRDKTLVNCGINDNVNTCPDNVPGVDPGPDPILNIMNYNDIQCDSLMTYTPGQIERMQAVYDMYRKPPNTVCKKRGNLCAIDKDCCGTMRCNKISSKCVMNTACPSSCTQPQTVKAWSNCINKNCLSCTKCNSAPKKLKIRFKCRNKFC